MATVQIADIYNPLTFNSKTQEAQIELNAFNQSGISVFDAVLENQFRTGGNIGELPQFNGLAMSEPNIGNDVPTDLVTPLNIASKTQIARINAANQHWSTMDLARDLALEDPMGAITNRVGAYWATHEEKLVINSCVGILADNVANDGSDMLESVYSDVVEGSLTAANKMGGNAVVDTSQTMGDHKEQIAVIAMHSKPHADLQKLGLLVDNFDPQSGAVRYQTYLGKRVIVDDSLPVVAGSNSPKYTSILFAAGVFSRAYAPPQVPSAVTREELVGDGAGQDILHSRNTSIYHPNGFQCIGGAWAKVSGASYAELAAAATWDRVVDRKNVGLAFLETN